MWKKVWKEMFTTIDGKKINWWVNGIAIFILVLMIIEVITNG
jgi:hypothetical protein